MGLPPCRCTPGCSPITSADIIAINYGRAGSKSLREWGRWQNVRFWGALGRAGCPPYPTSRSCLVTQPAGPMRCHAWVQRNRLPLSNPVVACAEVVIFWGGRWFGVLWGAAVLVLSLGAGCSLGTGQGSVTPGLFPACWGGAGGVLCCAPLPVSFFHAEVLPFSIPQGAESPLEQEMSAFSPAWLGKWAPQPPPLPPQGHVPRVEARSWHPGSLPHPSPSWKGLGELFARGKTRDQ